MAKTKTTKKPAAKKTAAKKTAAKKAPAKKAGAKKTAAKKAPAKKAVAKKTAAKKAGVKKTAAKKVPAKKAGVQKTAAKKTAAKKAPAKPKAAAKKTAGKKAAAKPTTAGKKTAGKKASAKPKTAAKKTAAKKAPAKKTAAKKTAAKKAPAKKAPAKPRAGAKKPAAKATGKRAPAKKAAATPKNATKASQGEALFGPQLLGFLTELGLNNDREWFKEHRARYESDVREPARAFVRTIAEPLRNVSAHFEANDKKVGGSIMRIHRDVRFAKDKAPYKTNVGIHFRHEAGRDIHAPGFFVHIEPGRHFVGVGMWRPDPVALAAIRKRIDEQPEAWVAATTGAGFANTFALAGESLKRAPKGVASDHPHLAALKRKDHIATASLTDENVLDAGFVGQLVGLFSEAAEYVRFQCDALEIPF